jgi:hypothetical protein
MLESMLSSSNDDLIVTAMNNSSRYSLLKASVRELSALKSKITLNQGGSMKYLAKVS